MKKKLFMLILMGIAVSSVSQEAKNLGKAFVMRQNYNANKCNAVGGGTSTTTDFLRRTHVVIVQAMTTTGYVVSLPQFNDSTLNQTYVRTPTLTVTYAAANGSSTSSVTPSQKIYFIIPFTDFASVCIEATPKHSFTVGLPTIPVKLRFGNKGTGTDPRYFRFDGNVNLGLSAGWKRTLGTKRQNAMNLLVGFTIASVNVDSITTKGRVKANTSAASFSPHFGVVFDFQQFQAGFYTGIDYLYGEPNRYWVYRNQPWLGIGIGYSLFKIGNPDAKN